MHDDWQAPAATAGSELEQAVFTSRDWCSHLRQRAAALLAEPLTPAIADAAFDVAQALEAAEPDRHHAIEMYLQAWKAGGTHDVALGRARLLCLEVGQMPTAAKIARIEYQRTADPSYLVLEASTWLDAGHPDQALAALAMAASELPDDDTVKLLFAAAREELTPQQIKAELSRLESEALSATSPNIASERMLQAARLVRMTRTGDDDLFSRLLRRAFEADPLNDIALALLEDLLIARNDRQGLTKSYEQRAAVSPHQAIDALRRAGTKLVLGRKNPGLGIQLIAAGLDRAYRTRTGPIQGHLAMLVLLRKFSESARVERDLLTMLARGLEMEHSPVEEAGLAVIGLDTAWTRLRDAGLAYPYAAVLARHADAHPLLPIYYAEGGMAAGHKISAELGDESIDVDFDDLELGPAGEGRAARDTLQEIEMIELAPMDANPPPVPQPPAPPPVPPPAPPRVARPAVDRPGAAALSIAQSTPAAPIPVKPLARPVPAQPAPARAAAKPAPVVTPPAVAKPAAVVTPPAAAKSAPVVTPAAIAKPAAVVTPPAGAKPAALITPPAAAKPTPVVTPPAAAAKITAPSVNPAGVKLAAIALVPRAALSAIKVSRSRPAAVAEPAPAAEVRRSERIRISADVQVTVAAAAGRPELRFSTVTRDVSETGLFIVTTERLSIGDRVSLSIDIPSLDDWEVSAFKLTGRVVRTMAGGYGIDLDDRPKEFVAKIRELAK